MALPDMSLLSDETFCRMSTELSSLTKSGSIPRPDWMGSLVFSLSCRDDAVVGLQTLKTGWTPRSDICCWMMFLPVVDRVIMTLPIKHDPKWKTLPVSSNREQFTGCFAPWKRGREAVSRLADAVLSQDWASINTPWSPVFFPLPSFLIIHLPPWTTWLSFDTMSPFD